MERLCSAGGLALYAGEFERHWLEVVKKDIGLSGLSAEFDGLTIAQLSDIHLDEFTEPFLLRQAVDAINQASPDMVLLTGDYVSAQVLPPQLTVDAVWQCGKLLSSLQCKQRYAIFGNHDIFGRRRTRRRSSQFTASPCFVTHTVPLSAGHAGSGFPASTILRWAAGSPTWRSRPASETCQLNRFFLMCHAPDYVDHLRMHTAGQAVSLVLSGHTHGGQIQPAVIGPFVFRPADANTFRDCSTWEQRNST